MRSMWIVGTCSAFASLTCFALAAEAPQPKDDFALLAEILAPPRGSPDPKGKPWVSVYRKRAGAPADLHGWRIEETADSLKVLDIYGTVHSHRKPRPGEKQPELPPPGRYSSSQLHPVFNGDRSVAWIVQEDDFTAAAKRFLAAVPPLAVEAENFRRLSPPQSQSRELEDVMAEEMKRFRRLGQVRRQAEDYIFEAARWAVVARRMGEKELATELHSNALAAHRVFVRTYSVDGRARDALHLFINEERASGQREGAISSGHYGDSRSDLQAMWKRLQEMPGHDHLDEAKAMDAYYASLLEEDARWVEPSAEAMQEFTPAEAAEYWIYKLRDLDAGQWSDPGTCYVLGTGAEIDPRAQSRRSAAVELKKLGEAAVPLLIEHLDDARPTRCQGHWRRHAPVGRYLLRYGDCCQQILRAIGGEEIFPGFPGGSYPMQEGKGSDLKKQAERWWAERRKTPPE